MAATKYNNPLVSLSLNIRNLDRSLSFYESRLGFTLHRREKHRAWLGSPDHPFLQLIEIQRMETPGPTTGLYHFAVLLPSRGDLALLLGHMQAQNTPLDGFADHGVSEAIYLQDPDGNGIEIYRDRPQEDWPESGGQLNMITAPLHTDQLLNLAGKAVDDWKGLPEGCILGHLHLQVDDISNAETFYQQTLGLDLRQRYGKSASFFSYGEYHHHIGVNTWNSKGAPPPDPRAPGLRWYTMRESPRMNLQDVEKLALPELADQDGHMIQDPAGIWILIVD